VSGHPLPKPPTLVWLAPSGRWAAVTYQGFVARLDLREAVEPSVTVLGRSGLTAAVTDYGSVVAALDGSLLAWTADGRGDLAPRPDQVAGAASGRWLRCFAVGGSVGLVAGPFGADPSSAQVWRADSGASRARLVTSVPIDDLYGLALSPEGDLLIWGGAGDAVVAAVVDGDGGVRGPWPSPGYEAWAWGTGRELLAWGGGHFDHVAIGGRLLISEVWPDMEHAVVSPGGARLAWIAVDRATGEPSMWAAEIGGPVTGPWPLGLSTARLWLAVGDDGRVSAVAVDDDLALAVALWQGGSRLGQWTVALPGEEQYRIADPSVAYNQEEG
jgi:hypothetical protein